MKAVGNTTPRVSVCIPAYNAAGKLPDVLRELWQQEYGDYEIVLCDDGSTDHTWELLCSLRQSNVRVLKNSKNLNLPLTMKRLFDEARGELIAMHHDHEYAKPAWLKTMVAMFDRYPNVGIAIPGNDCLLADGTLEERRSRREEELVFAKNTPISGQALIEILAVKPYTPISAHGTVFRASVVREVGGYSAEWGLASDEDLYRRVAAVSDLVFCPEALVVRAVRAQERQGRLGSVIGLCTIYAFRKDTTARYWRKNRLAKRFNLWRLNILERRALGREVLHCWLFGRPSDLATALGQESVRVLPTGSPAMTCWDRCILHYLIYVMSKWRRLGCWLGRIRRNLQGRAG